MHVRRFEHHEWNIYRDLRLSALKDSPDAFCTTLSYAQQLSDRQWRSRISQCDATKNYPILALSEMEPCGLGWAAIDEGNDDKAHLYQLWIAPNYRRLGIGRLIIESAILWARTAGAQDLNLGIISGNSGAENLYQSLGFEKIGTPLPLDDRDGLWNQDMVLNLNLQ